MTITLSPMTPAQAEGWNGLLDVAERHPSGWTLVGGQMVQLHCIERDTTPGRPTDDVDTVLDVRAEPQVLHTFTIETPGAQQALDRSEAVEVTLDGRTGKIRRPDLLGALVAKAAAHSVVLDRARSRHLLDLATLTTLVRPSDRIGRAGPRDRRQLEAALAAMAADVRTWAGVDGAADGIARLRLALEVDQPAAPRTMEVFTRRSP